MKCAECLLAPNVANDCRILSHMALDEWNQHHGFQIDRVAIFGAGAELPARESALGGLIEARIDAVEHLDAAYSSIGMNDGIKLDDAFHVVAQCVSRISGIVLRGSY